MVRNTEALNLFKRANLHGGIVTDGVTDDITETGTSMRMIQLCFLTFRLSM